MMKPSFLLLFSGGLASTTTLLKAVRENEYRPLLLFFWNQGPAGEGEHLAARRFSNRYGLSIHIMQYASPRLYATQYEEEMIHAACVLAEQQGVDSVVCARKTFLSNLAPPLRRKAVPILYIPEHEHTDEDYRTALDYEPALFRETFSCTETFNLVPCGKCAKCREREALYSRIRSH